jgi:hypothetical protein
VSEDTERRRVAAAVLSEMLDEAPEYVDPDNAGAIGFLLSQDADPASDDAALARRLLGFAVGNAPDDRPASSWRLALGMIHRWPSMATSGPRSRRSGGSRRPGRRRRTRPIR